MYVSRSTYLEMHLVSMQYSASVHAKCHRKISHLPSDLAFAENCKCGTQPQREWKCRNFLKHQKGLAPAHALGAAWAVDCTAGPHSRPPDSVTCQAVKIAARRLPGVLAYRRRNLEDRTCPEIKTTGPCISCSRVMSAGPRLASNNP